MCRFIAYTGHPILVEEILIKPRNSLIKQSIHAREAVETLNGDGFGLAWYDHTIDPTPGLFKSIRPAWNNLNLIHLAAKIKSTCFLAHVRAASEGSVNGNNCHPFSYRTLTFMHNGSIENFKKIKRHLRHLLNDEIYEWVKGETDSEHFFALLLQYFADNKITEFNFNNTFLAMNATIKAIQDLQEEYNAKGTIYLNAVLSDGQQILATRYVNESDTDPSTLYYAAGSRFEYKDGFGHMYPANGNNGAVLIVSERLTDFPTEWHLIPRNNCLFIDKTLNLSCKQLD